jgi:hypothetical protein
MRSGRLIFALALALMTALAAQPASPQRHAQQFRPPKAQPQKPKGNTNKPAPKPGNANAPHPNANGGYNANGQTGPKANNPNNNNNGGQPAAHPPNPDAFRPNPNVVRPDGAPNAQGNAGAMRSLPGPWIQRLGEKSPEEQERFLQNNREFQNLPPERQAQIRRNLQRWNALSPAQRDQMIHGERVLETLSPQKRDLYQNHILPKLQQMSQDRRQLINGRLHTLQGMTPADQQRALNDPRFMQGLSPDEQGVLRDVVSLRNPNP